MCTLDTDMYLVHSESTVIDLYCLGSKDEQRNSVPFKHTIQLHGPRGEVVRLMSTFDDGALASAVDLKVFQRVEHRLKPLQRSNRILRMADGRLVPSKGVWNGSITVGDTSHNGAFEVFDSNGAWSVLFGKPLLKTFKAIHDYDSDIVRIPKGDSWTELKNQHHSGEETRPLLSGDFNPNINQRINFKGDHCAPPSRQVPCDESDGELVDVVKHEIAPLPMGGQGPDIGKRTSSMGDHGAPPLRQVSQPDNSINELVDEAMIEQTERGDHTIDGGEQEEEDSSGCETPRIQHPLTQEGNRRRTREERIKWREANGYKGKKSRTD